MNKSEKEEPVETPEKKKVNLKHRMNRSTRHSPETIKINLEIPELKKLIKKLKKLCYAIGCFNSYTTAMTKMLDNSMFGFSICLQKDEQSGLRKVKISRMKEDEQFEAEITPAMYLNKVRSRQIEIVEKIFKVINEKIRVLEAFLIKEIPEMVKIFQQEQILRVQNTSTSRGSTRLPRETSGYLPRLYEYKPDPNIHKPKRFKMNFTNIVAMRYSYCSHLLFFLNSENKLVVYDLFQQKISQEISQWPFSIKNIILRRNLNFYNSKSLLRVEFKKFDHYVSVEEEKGESAKVVTEKDFENLAYIVLEMKDYFSNFSNNIWFHKRNKWDKYILVFQFHKKNQLFFFYFVYKFKELQEKKRRETLKNASTASRGSSMVNLTRSVSLHKQKTSKFSRMFTKSAR